MASILFFLLRLEHIGVFAQYENMNNLVPKNKNKNIGFFFKKKTLIERLKQILKMIFKKRTIKQKKRNRLYDD